MRVERLHVRLLRDEHLRPRGGRGRGIPGRLLEPIWGTREFVNSSSSSRRVSPRSSRCTSCTSPPRRGLPLREVFRIHGVLAPLMVKLRRPLPRIPLAPLTKMRNKHPRRVLRRDRRALPAARHPPRRPWLSPRAARRGGFTCGTIKFDSSIRVRGWRRGRGSRARRRQEEFEFAAQFPAAFAPALRARPDPCPRSRLRASANAAVATNVRGERRRSRTATVAETGQRGEESGERMRVAGNSRLAAGFSRRGCERGGGAPTARASGTERAATRDVRS